MLLKSQAVSGEQKKPTQFLALQDTGFNQLKLQVLQVAGGGGGSTWWDMRKSKWVDSSSPNRRGRTFQKNV